MPYFYEHSRHGYSERHKLCYLDVFHPTVKPGTGKYWLMYVCKSQPLHIREYRCTRATTPRNVQVHYSIQAFCTIKGMLQCAKVRIAFRTNDRGNKP